MARVLANATVDVLRAPPEDCRGLTTFKVEVFGREPHDYVRTYQIAAKSDNIAAQEALRRFEAEFEDKE